jgi:hypothetical protein
VYACRRESVCLHLKSVGLVGCAFDVSGVFDGGIRRSADSFLVFLHCYLGCPHGFLGVDGLYVIIVVTRSRQA